MSQEFKLPELGEGVESADVAELLVAEGDEIQANQTVMELETDKAVVELPCPIAGKIAKIHVASGESIKVGQTLLTIDESAAGGDDKSSDKATKNRASREESPRETAAAKPAPEEESAARPADGKSREAAATPKPRQAEPKPAVKTRDGRPPQPAPAGPATRRLAHVLNIALDHLKGSGPRGRITLEDVVREHETRISGRGGAAALPKLPDFSKEGAIEEVHLNKIAQTTIENLTRSWQLIPHVTQQGFADVTDLEAVRHDYVKRIGPSAPKVTLTAVAVKACVAVLKEFPKFNSSVDVEGKRLIFKKYYNIGIAVDTEHGLVVPVIRDADRKDIADIAAEIQDFAERAKQRKLDVKDMQGATFTISNQGGIGGTAFTPIVNWPQVAILGMSRTAKQAMVVDDEQRIRLILPLSLSYDHRAANGADAARFIVRLGDILSDSRRLMFEI